MYGYQNWMGAVVLAAAVTLFGCDGGGVERDNQEDIRQEGREMSSKSRDAGGGDGLEQRVLNRWDAKIAHNWRAAYGYLSPAARELVPLHIYETYARSGAIRWIDVIPVGKQCRGAAGGIDEVCSVAVRVKSVRSDRGLGGGGEMFDVIEENWIRYGSDWWYVPKE